MPRVNADELLGRRDLLVVCWKFIPQYYALLPPLAQWELHRSFGPSLELTDEEVLDRLLATAELEPTLPNKCGKHYAVIFNRYKSYSDVVGKTNVEMISRMLNRDLSRMAREPDVGARGRRKRNAEVFGVVRPEIDTAKLARTFLALAEREREGRTRKDAA